jgi:peroxiredoxin
MYDNLVKFPTFGSANSTIMKNIILSIFLLSGIISIAQNTQTMPDMILKDVNGKNKNVSDYSKNGKITIISFWATWCTPCKKELVNINDNMLDDWKNKYGVELVAVSTDNSKNVLKVKPYVDGMGWEFDCLLDVNEDLKRSLNAPIVPYTVLLDRAGNIVYTHIGYMEGDEYVLEEKIKSIAGKK